MSQSSGSEADARRFLHCCYCCRHADAATRLFSEGLGLELRMRSAGARLDGSQLGFLGEVETDACFVYDARGPRVSPAIEVQEWIDPPTIGNPYGAAHDIGFHALGISVPDVDATIERLLTFGATVVGVAPPESPICPKSTIVKDPTGVHVDLVESRDRGGHTQLTHLRGTCSDLDRSIDWYSALGFRTIDMAHSARMSGVPFGLGDEATASVARLRLPDEPFELVLVEWHEPRSRGAPYAEANHAGLYRFAIAVDDTRAAWDRLSRAGVAVSAPPEVVRLPGTNVPDMWIAFLADPDGMVVELVERPRSAFR